jgi:hypothetical protein
MDVIPTEDQYAADSIGSLEMDSFRELQELMMVAVLKLTVFTRRIAID